MDDGKDALGTLDRLFGRYGDSARYCIVKNQGRGKDFSLFERSPTRARPPSWGHGDGAARAARPGHAEDRAPRRQLLGRDPQPRLGAESFSRMDRQRIKVWLLVSYDQLARLGDKL